MGVYDTVEIGGNHGQLKCWTCQFKKLTIGDWVGPVQGFHTYNIAMREGGYLHVFDGRISGWDRIQMRSENAPVFDKYGQEFTPETKGELGEVLDDPYFFKGFDA